MEDKKSDEKKRDITQNDWYLQQSLHHWRRWGSWFSWGSPVGLGLGYSLIIISTGIFLWLLSQR